VLGFDDAPFERTEGAGSDVGLAGVVCADAQFEGMVWETVTEDGWDATETIIERVRDSKFADQIHAILLDGIAFGGFNVVDVPAIVESLEVPCGTVMRSPPDWASIEAALTHVNRPEARLERMKRAGEVHEIGDIYMQVCGPAEVSDWARAVPRLTRQGHVPEALRLAHLIARAVVTGESGRRA
jgi:endonuclease V-like protein UPF0215 family